MKSLHEQDATSRTTAFNRPCTRVLKPLNMALMVAGWSLALSAGLLDAAQAADIKDVPCRTTAVAHSLLLHTTITDSVRNAKRVGVILLRCPYQAPASMRRCAFNSCVVFGHDHVTKTLLLSK